MALSNFSVVAGCTDVSPPVMIDVTVLVRITGRGGLIASEPVQCLQRYRAEITRLV
jgi:hypothetical protein